jgi:serine phosphatase RsbU (regulator of sigma subunit)
MFYAVLDLPTGSLVYGNAGAFPHPILASGAETSELECSGRPLNLPGRAGFGSGEARLRPGDRLLLASDGVLELSPRVTHRKRREQLRAALAEARSLDDITGPLGLADHTSLRDDVALLFLHHEEKP